MRFAKSGDSAGYAPKTLALPENKKHYPGLDGLRAIAVLMVMFEHYIPVRADLDWGWAGVRIFFVLSGFLITGILYDTRNAERRWSVFYARRALRIFPLYYAVLLFAVASYPFFHWRLHPSQILWPFYLQNFNRFLWPAGIQSGVVDHLVSPPLLHPFRLLYGHLWSLAVEEQFYLIWPLVVFAVKRRENLMRLCIGAVLLSPLLRLWCALHLSPVLIHAGFLERFTFLQCDSLLLGGLFALWKEGPHPDFTKLAARMLGFAGLAALISEAASMHLYGHFVRPSYISATFTSLGYTIINVISIAVILLAIDAKTRLSRLLQNRRLRYLGMISYGFYVFHDIPHLAYMRLILLVPGAWRAQDLICFAVAFFATLALASASYYGFERPFLALKRYFTVLHPATTGSE